MEVFNKRDYMKLIQAQPEDVCGILGSSREGLSSDEAAERLAT